MEKERHLSVVEREQVWAAIRGNIKPDDRDPYEIIDQDCKGDEEQYLLKMGRYFRIIDIDHKAGKKKQPSHSVEKLR